MQHAGKIVCSTLTSLLVFLFSCTNLNNYGKHEKHWAYTHPIAVIKLTKIKKKCDVIYKDVKKSNVLDTFENGGKLDAFRHTFYMAMFATKIKASKVQKLGQAHEQDNFISFTKQQNEDGELPDSLSMIMDLLNNENGISLAQQFKKNRSINEIKDSCISYIHNGHAYFIKRDKLGNYLHCDGTILYINNYKGFWNIPKCLVRR